MYKKDIKQGIQGTNYEGLITERDIDAEFGLFSEERNERVEGGDALGGPVSNNGSDTNRELGKWEARDGDAQLNGNDPAIYLLKPEEPIEE